MDGSINRFAMAPKLSAGGLSFGAQRVETGQMTEVTARPVCSTCGRVPDDDSDARLTWVLGIENGQRVWTCDRCSRENLRSIEGKLDSPWW